MSRPRSRCAGHPDTMPGSDFYGGYCFLNNVAIAAQYLARPRRRSTLAIVDVDYHHGNGTQNIFYARGDVFFASIHADPDFEFPFLSGYADEAGIGAGEGANLNLPLPAGTGWPRRGPPPSTMLSTACAVLLPMRCSSRWVSIRTRNPIRSLNSVSRAMTLVRMGEKLAALGPPAAFVLEGGYAVAELGVNAVNVLQGFEGAL